MTERLLPFWIVTWAHHYAGKLWVPDVAPFWKYESAAAHAARLAPEYNRNFTITGPFYLRVPT